MRTIELVASEPCQMRSLRRDAITALMSEARERECGANPGAAPAAITISLECWRDANGKLHCKLSVSLGAA